MKTHSGSFAVSWTVYCVVSVGVGVVDPSKSDACESSFWLGYFAVAVEIIRFAGVNVWR